MHIWGHFYWYCIVRIARIARAFHYCIAHLFTGEVSCPMNRSCLRRYVKGFIGTNNRIDDNFEMKQRRIVDVTLSIKNRLRTCHMGIQIGRRRDHTLKGLNAFTMPWKIRQLRYSTYYTKLSTEASRFLIAGPLAVTRKEGHCDQVSVFYDLLVRFVSVRSFVLARQVTSHVQPMAFPKIHCSQRSSFHKVPISKP